MMKMQESYSFPGPFPFRAHPASSHGLQSLTFSDASRNHSARSSHERGTWGVTRTSLLLQETTKGVAEGRTWVSLAMGMLSNIRPTAPLAAIVTPRNKCKAVGA